MESDIAIGNLGLVVQNARKLAKLQMEVGELEEKLKDKKHELRTFAFETMPELMLSEHVTDLGLDNGYRLELDEVFQANLPAKSTIQKADEEEQPALLKRYNDGMQWLISQKADDIIKNRLVIDLGKDTKAETKAFLQLAKKLKVPVDQSQTVHPGTLKKYLQEKLAKGADVPLETFAVVVGHEAKIIAPQPTKGEL